MVGEIFFCVVLGISGERGTPLPHSRDWVRIQVICKRGMGRDHGRQSGKLQPLRVPESYRKPCGVCHEIRQEVGTEIGSHGVQKRGEDVGCEQIGNDAWACSMPGDGSCHSGGGSGECERAFAALHK